MLLVISLCMATCTCTFDRKQNSKMSDEVVTDPVIVFHRAMENAQPVVGVQPIKKAGKTYQVRY